MALTREQLDKLGCNTPGCTCDDSELVIRSRCHDEAPTWAWYDKRDGTLTVKCAVCDSTVAVVQVAQKGVETWVTH